MIVIGFIPSRSQEKKSCFYKAKIAPQQKKVAEAEGRVGSQLTNLPYAA